MSDSSSRHLRRFTMTPTGRDDLSEGVLVAVGDRTVIEVVGGPPFATLELFAADRWIGSVTLDRLGVGSSVVTDDAIGDGRTSVALCHGGRTVLEGFLGSDLSADGASVKRS